MRKRWIVWSLPLLLAASVLAGMALDRGFGSQADAGEKQGEAASDQLPEFDCEERSGSPYRRDEATKEKHLDWMESKLDLSPEQMVRMESVFDDASFRADEFWRATRDSYCELRDRMLSDIRTQLTAGQERELDRLIEEHRSGDSEGSDNGGAAGDGERD